MYPHQIFFSFYSLGGIKYTLASYCKSLCDLVGRWYCTCRMSGWRGEGEINVSVMEGVDSNTSTCTCVSVPIFYFCISRMTINTLYVKVRSMAEELS